MYVNAYRRLFVLGVGSLALSGCASLTPQTRIELQRHDEQLVQSRPGRFVVQAISTPASDELRGSQGRFEWLEYRSPQTTRTLLIIVGAFGQSLGGIEETQTELHGEPRLRLFDEQGRLIDSQQQSQLVTMLAGQHVPAGRAQIAALQELMKFIAQAAHAGQRVHETNLMADGLQLQFRVAFDAQ